MSRFHTIAFVAGQTPEAREAYGRLSTDYGNAAPETADVIVLYGARQPVIVHDAYTARVIRRVGSGPERDGYEVWRAWLDARLPADLASRWRGHAAIVVHCKETCRVKPRCSVCPLADFCEYHIADQAEKAPTERQ